MLMRDEYPPFTGERGQYPLMLEVEYREDLSRWMIFVKWLLAIPHVIVLAFLGIAAYIAVVIAFFAVLFTGKYPRGLFDFVVGTARWAVRVNAYAFWFMTTAIRLQPEVIGQDFLCRKTRSASDLAARNAAVGRGPAQMRPIARAPAPMTQIYGKQP
jgi:hypothetical protein